jgi:hypothetical protein
MVRLSAGVKTFYSPARNPRQYHRSSELYLKSDRLLVGGMFTDHQSSSVLKILGVGVGHDRKMPLLAELANRLCLGL